MTASAKPIYSMSAIGRCKREVVALRLGNEPVPDKEFMELAAKEGERHEVFIAEEIAARGYTVYPPQMCYRCNRRGVHVELDFPAFKLVGHMDRLITFPLTTFPTSCSGFAEFKALSRFRTPKLVSAIQKGNLTFCAEFRDYAIQVSAYAHASGLPFVYAVKCRDTGRVDIFDSLKGEISSPYTLQELEKYVLELEILARKNTLPPCDFSRGDFERDICSVKYLCAGMDKPALVIEVNDVDLAEAVTLWRRANEAKVEADDQVGKAKAVFLNALKSRSLRTLTVDGVRLTHIKGGKGVTYPKAKIEAVLSKEVLEGLREEREYAEYVKVEDLQAK